jgi:hypothetical protein
MFRPFFPVEKNLGHATAHSRQAPDAALDVQQQTGIAHDLELLADSCPVSLFYGVVADVAVVGMKSFQSRVKA